MLFAFFVFAFVAVCIGQEIDQRIVGGQPATYGEHPYICSLQMRSFFGWYHICGSVIWNQQYVVTAAHCLSGSLDLNYAKDVDCQMYGEREFQSCGAKYEKERASNLRVVCGNHRLASTDDYQVTHPLASYTLHPLWQPSGAGYPNDIALMKVKNPLTFNDHVDKIPFATSGSFLGEQCKLTGWGRLQGGGPTANTLKKVNLTKISQDECRSKWSGVFGAQINDGHICFYEGQGYSACNGDSGGPCRCGNTLTGITSWGISSCSGSYPSVYTRVSHFHSWLQSIAGPQ